MLVEEYKSLIDYNTFKIEAKSRWFAQYNSPLELTEAFTLPLFNSNPILAIGTGSNILFTKDYPGIVLHSTIQSIETVDETESEIYLKVGSGVVWDEFVAHCAQNGWYGAENLSLIPGEVGAAAVQNIGAYGVEAKDLIHSVEAFHRKKKKICTLHREDCLFGYRTSVFKKANNSPYLILYVTFRLSKQPSFNLSYGHLDKEFPDKETLTLGSLRNKIIAIRQAKLPDPAQLGNAGSYFMNPIIAPEQFRSLQEQFPSIPSYPTDNNQVKIPAAWLIEQCGWKEQSTKKVGVHPQQCLVIINYGGATAKEIVDYADLIIHSVNTKFNIRLVPEVIYL